MSVTRPIFRGADAVVLVVPVVPDVVSLLAPLLLLPPQPAAASAAITGRASAIIDRLVFSGTPS